MDEPTVGLTEGRRDRHGLTILSYEQCLERIAAAPVGRIAFRSDDGLTVMPVNHRLRGLQIAFRTAPGAKLDAALRGAEVAFQVDGFDSDDRTGWSVLARGTATPARATQFHGEGDVAPWADDVPRDRWVIVTIEHVTGRLIPPSGADLPAVPATG